MMKLDGPIGSLIFKWHMLRMGRTGGILICVELFFFFFVN